MPEPLCASRMRFCLNPRFFGASASALIFSLVELLNFFNLSKDLLSRFFEYNALNKHSHTLFTPEFGSSLRIEVIREGFLVFDI